MKALFVYTAKVFTCGGKHYSNNLPASIWKDRYKKVFDEVVVYAREVPVEICKEACSDYDGISFKLTNLGIDKVELVSKNKQIYDEIEKMVIESDFVVARMGFFGVLAARCARKHKKPYVCEVVGSSWDDLWNYSLFGKMAAIWLQPQVKYEVKKSKRTVYVTNEYLQKKYPYGGEQVGISNVILAKHSDERFQNRVAKIEEAGNNKPWVLGTAAAIDVPYKGQRYVIYAIKKLSDLGVNCVYRVAGNGNREPLMKVAEKLHLENQLEVLGAIPHERMSDYFDGLDIYVQPSLQEGLPRAMIEAMGSGLPAIGFKTAGIPELVESEYVCKQKNVDDIVKSVLKIVSNKDEQLRVSRRNYEKSFEYEKEILENRWFDFYSNAISFFNSNDERIR